jgi:hypothetical protein
MFKNYKFWLLFLVLSAAVIAVVQGCGSNSPIAQHTVYGGTS